MGLGDLHSIGDYPTQLYRDKIRRGFINHGGWFNIDRCWRQSRFPNCPHFPLVIHVSPWKKTSQSLFFCPWKMIVGKRFSFWDGKCSRAMLNFQGSIRVQLTPEPHRRWTTPMTTSTWHQASNGRNVSGKWMTRDTFEDHLSGIRVIIHKIG